MAGTIQVRVDDELKVKSDELFIALGADTATVMGKFFIQALTETEMLNKLEKSREHAAQGMYRDADDVSRDMRTKYGL